MDGSVRWVFEPRQQSASILGTPEVAQANASADGSGGTLLRMDSPVVGICVDRCRGSGGVLAKTAWLSGSNPMTRLAIRDTLAVVAANGSVAVFDQHGWVACRIGVSLFSVVEYRRTRG